MAIPLIGSKRAVTAFAVFACINVVTTAIPPGNGRAPLGLQIQFPLPLTTNGVTVSALYGEYLQLTSIYRRLQDQDLPNNRANLYAVISLAATAVTALIATLATITVSGDNVFVLAGLQSVAAQALVTIQNVQSDEL